MSFDLLATILFLLFFVVGPLLRRAGGQRRQPPGGGGRPSGRQSAERAGPPQEPAGSDEGGPLSRRLEEARRRVLEAMGESEQQTRGSTTGHQGGRPVSAPLVPATKAAVDSASGKSPKLDWQASAKAVEPFIAPRPRPRHRTSADDGPAVTKLSAKRRTSARPAAKIRVERRPALDEDGIINGMIWHEILSEPVSRRGTRRVRSRLRSR